MLKRVVTIFVFIGFFLPLITSCGETNRIKNITDLTEEELKVAKALCQKPLKDFFGNQIIAWYATTYYYLPTFDEILVPDSSKLKKLKSPITLSSFDFSDCFWGYDLTREGVTLAEEDMPALVAKKSAEMKLQSLGKQGDLIMVIAGSFITWERSDGVLYYTIPAWVFVFRDPKDMAKTTSIEVKIQKRKKEGLTIVSKITDINFPKELSITSKPIRGWKIDNDVAEYLVRKGGGFPYKGTFILKMRDVDGEFLPVWILPYRYADSVIRGIRADNGKFVYLKRKEEDKWTASKPKY